MATLIQRIEDIPGEGLRYSVLLDGVEKWRGSVAWSGPRAQNLRNRMAREQERQAERVKKALAEIPDSSPAEPTS